MFRKNFEQKIVAEPRQFLKGDKVLWMVIILISIFSIFPVYSASSNLEYIVNNGTTTEHIIKHTAFVVLGLFIMRLVGTVKYEYIGKLSSILLVITIILLIITIYTGQKAYGNTASRWLKIPGTPISFQPSTFAYLMLIIYLCRYLTKKISSDRLPIENIIYLFVPTLLIFVLVARDNGSTALMIVFVSLVVMALGRLSMKYIFVFLGAMFMCSLIFILVSINTDFIGGSRINTWKSRIETFTKKNDETLTEIDKAKNYQIIQARAAVVHGGLFGIGPGKSALKQSLPQSVSDFIFAIIVEEYGLIGASILIILYFIMIVRIVMIASKIPMFFGSLLVLALGVMIFVQLSINIAVAVNLIPVTGQPLPLISYGGTSMLVTYLQLGIILNVSSRILVYNEEGIGKKQLIEEINDIA